MARYTDSVCRYCRREGMKLFLKGDRCYSDKCSVERRNYPPGQHGQSRAKFSEYGTQLREKQKVKRFYGVLERRFYNTFVNAARMKGVTGYNLVQLLERRMDVVVFRMGFTSSRSQARMWIAHGHFTVNGRKVDIPSFRVDVGDKIAVKEKSKKIEVIKENLANASKRAIPRWLSVDIEGMAGVVNEFPTREEITMPMQEQLIVELYSK